MKTNVELQIFLGNSREAWLYHKKNTTQAPQMHLTVIPKTFK